MPNVAFWDVDTQNDFMLPEGKLYVKGSERIRPNLRKVYAFAKKWRTPVVATGDAHALTDQEMEVWPPHCLKGTDGQRKLPETVLAKPIVVPHDKPAEAPELKPGTQVIVEKCHLDAFTNPRAREIVEKSGIDRWIVFGVATDYCVRLAALGLLKLGKKVTVLSDAIQGVKEETSRQAVIEMQAAGADFKSTAAVLKSLSPPAARPRRRPPAPRARRAGATPRKSRR